MKITPKQYASALHESIKDKNNNDIEKIVKEFARVLVLNNFINKHEAIVEEFIKIWNKENKIIEARVSSANEIAKADVKAIGEYIKKISEAETVKLETRIDKTLLGGVVMEYGDKILDGSLKTRVGELKRAMKR